MFRRKRKQSDFNAEVEAHIALEADRLKEQGLSEKEAQAAARRAFGNVTRARERFYESGRWRWWDELSQDIRYGLRQLRRNPGFTVVAILTLALGIGANTAIFSLIDAVMFRSLPVRNPSQLALLRWVAHKEPGTHETSLFGDCNGGGGKNPSGCSFPYPFLELIRSEKEVFSGAAAFAGPAQLVLSGKGPAKLTRGEIVSADYFSTLGVNVAMGRALGPEDDLPSASPAIVLSNAFWQSTFGGDSSAVGRTILLNAVPFTIVGVAEPNFTSLSPGKTQDFWLPTSMVPRLNIPWGRNTRTEGNWWLVILARLKPGNTIAKAQAAASITFRNEMLHGQQKPLWKASDDPRIELVPAQQGLTGVRWFFSKSLYVLTFAVGLILLIACANIAGLLLARAATRQKEMAVRLAVGASRHRITRQLLTESVLLSLAGGALGVLFAYWGIQVIIVLISGGVRMPFHFMVGPDWRILAFTTSTSLLTGILFGLAPAFRSTRLDLTPALKENASTAPPEEMHPGRKFSLGKALVVVQVGLSLVVLIGATLLVRTLQSLHDINPGFDTQNLLLFGINPSLEEYKDSQIQTLYQELQDRLASLPGVSSVSYSSNALLSGSLWTSTVHVEGQPQETEAAVDMLATGPDFFGTMRIPLVGGRLFRAEDFRLAGETPAADQPSAVPNSSSTSPPSNKALVTARPSIPALVNQAFVRKYLPDQNPLGKRLAQGNGSGTSGNAAVGKPKSKNWEIVGVVGDAKYNNLRRAIHPTIYLPFTGGGAYFELRTTLDPAALIPAVRRSVESLDKDIPIFEVQTQSESIEGLMIQERAIAHLSSLFGMLALLLACIGLYGLLAYEVARRKREIGIRVALGAEKRDVLRMVVQQGLSLAIVGVAIGIAGALAVTRFLASLLYGVTPTDPLTFIAVSLILIAVALAACYIPARRASKVDPMVALRYE